MMIDRKLYQRIFTQNNIPSWHCPTCNSGILSVDEKHFISEHTASTTAIMKEDWFDPADMAGLTYTALLRCTNPKCLEAVTSSGSGFVEQEYDEKDWSYVTYFKPKFFYPPLQIFKIPDEIKEAIQTSFSLIFNNKSASANQIRIALECLLTNLKVKRFNTRTGHRRTRLNLHQRIGLLPAKYQEVKDVCFAIKWLGNSGSHCDEDMKFDDVFNGYDMLSFLLDEIYNNRHHHVKKLAKTINAKKGV